MEVSGGAIRPFLGSSSNSGIEWLNDPVGGADDRAFLKYYTEGPDNTRMKIGIINDPEDELDVIGSGGINFITGPNFGYIGDFAGPFIFYKSNPDGTLTERMRIDHDGNVGIGTPDPINKLQIDGDVRIGLITDDDGSTEGYGNKLYFSGGDDWGEIDGLNHDSDNSDELSIARYNVGSDDSELRINIGDEGGDRLVVGRHNCCGPLAGLWQTFLRVGGDGKVGINTFNPSGTLHVQSGLTNSSDSIFLVATSGNVGIGQENPDQKLVVNGGILAGNGFPQPVGSGNAGYSFIGDGNYDTGIFSDEDGVLCIYNQSGRTLLTNTENNIGIGIDDPTAKIDINNPAGFGQLRLRNSYTPDDTSDPNGNIGDISWDDNYFYVKTNAGWKRTALGTW